MCGGGSQQTSTTTTRLPAWLEERYRDLLERGEEVADLPYVAYGGPRLAPFSADQEAAFQGIRDASGIYGADLDRAREYAGIAAAPMADTVGSFDRAAYDRYADPFNQAVIDATIADIERTGELARRDLDARAGVGGGIGSYGPSERATLERAEQWRDQSDATARAVAQLRSQNFAQAQNQFNTEQNRALAARQNDAARAAAAANQYVGIGGAGQDYALRDAGARYGIGATQQGQAQRGLDISYADFLEQRGYPKEQASWLSSIYRGYPGGTGTTTQTVPGANPWAQGIGAGIGILGTSGAFPSAGYSGWLGGLFKRGGVVKARRAPPRSPFGGVFRHMGRKPADRGIAGYRYGGTVTMPGVKRIARQEVARHNVDPQAHANMADGGVVHSGMMRRRMSPRYADGGIAGYQMGGQVHSGLSTRDLARMAEAGDSVAYRELNERMTTGRGPAIAAEASDFIGGVRRDYDNLVGGAGDDDLIDMERDDEGVYSPAADSGIAAAAPRYAPSMADRGGIAAAGIGHNGGPPLDEGGDDIGGWRPNLPVARAGFAMAASRNPSLLGALAEGAFYGIDAYEQQRADDRVARLQDRRIRMEEEAAQREQTAAQQQQAAMDAAIAALPLDQQAAARVNPDAFLKPQETFKPDLQTINRGGSEETGYFDENGDWVLIATAPRWQPQQALQATETERLLKAAGIDPASPEGQAIIRSKLSGNEGPKTLEERDQQTLLSGDPASSEYEMAYTRTFLTPRFVQGTNEKGEPTMLPIMPEIPPSIRPPKSMANGAGGGKAVGPRAGEAIVTGNPKPPAEHQANAAGYATRMLAAEPLIQQFESVSTSALEKAKASVPLIGNYLASSEYQQFQQAAADWVRAKLRKESGAVIGEEEMQREIETYFPQPGDSEATIAQKRAARDTATKTMIESAGPAYGSGATVKRWKIVNGELVPE
jgi:hypothetical protein